MFFFLKKKKKAKFNSYQNENLISSMLHFTSLLLYTQTKKKEAVPVIILGGQFYLFWNTPPSLPPSYSIFIHSL
jgi:hypothetical protein